jgi:hypothetical protein
MHGATIKTIKINYLFFRVRSLKFKVRGILLRFMWCIGSPCLFAYSRALRRLCSAKSIDSPIGLQPTYMGPRDLRLKCAFLTKHCLKVTCGCGMPLLLNTGSKLSSFFFDHSTFIQASNLWFCCFQFFFYVFVPSDMHFLILDWPACWCNSDAPLLIIGMCLFESRQGHRLSCLGFRGFPQYL